MIQQLKFLAQRGMQLAFFAVFGVAITVACLICSGKAIAHPYDAPQIGDFVSDTFLCSGEFSPMSGNQIAEFSGTWMGERDAVIKIVEFKNGEPSDEIDGTLFVGVNDRVYTIGNYAVLNRAVGVNAFQSVVLRVEGIRPSQEFGIYAAWFPEGEYVLLARWKGNEQNKCGDPLAQYQRSG